MSKEKILIADDEPHVLNLCARIVEKDGYQFKAVNDGYQAIEAARQERFDLFLTDLQMPKLGGLETAQQIRTFRPDIICVVMTGFGTMERAIQAIRLGFTEFVEKPFKPLDLSQAINRALEKERLRREVARLNALLPLLEFNKTLMTNVNPDELARKVLDATCQELNAGMGALLLFDRNQHLHPSATIGMDEGNIPEPLIKELVDRRELLLVHAHESSDSHGLELANVLGVEHLLFAPLLAMDVSVGAMVVAKPAGEEMAAGDSELLSLFCGQAAVALQNSRLFDDIQRAYKELQKVDHIKSEFINIAAHELRTPLAILLGHADLLEEEIQDTGIKTRMQIIVRNALRLRELINALLDMRLLQTGEQRTNIVAFDLRELIDDVLQDLNPWITGKKLKLAIHVPDNVGTVRSDRQKMHIVLGNLVRNAIKFTDSEGQVGIDVETQGKELWVSVWDTGIGIPKDELENIFRPFYQVEDSLTREHDGIGLGLSITKGMIELCGERIWVESEVGKGSRFTFTLQK